MKTFLIVIANYYEDISKKLLNSALNIIPKSIKIRIIKVPGVFEIPVVISKNIKKYDGFLLWDVLLKVKHHILILFLKLQLME